MQSRWISPPALAIGALCLFQSPPPSVCAQESLVNPLTVAVIEEVTSTGVVDREHLTRTELETMMLERSNRVIGYSEEQLVEEDALPESADSGSFFDRSRIALLGESEREAAPPQPERPESESEVPPPSDPEIEETDGEIIALLEDLNSRPSATEIQEESPSLQALDPALREMLVNAYTERSSENLELQIWNLRQQVNREDEEVLEDSQRRYRREFERQVINEWVDRMLLIMESRRRGYQVSEVMMTEQLVPMLQARRTQLLRDQRDEEMRISPEDIQRIETTITMIESSPAAVESQDVRRSVRHEVERLVSESGADSDRFFQELEENLLIDRLVRSTVYEYYTEEDLRRYHETYRDEFLLPPRFQALAVKYYLQRGDTSDVVRDGRDAMEHLARRLRRIDEDMPLDDVISEWQSLLAAEENLPPTTYMALSGFMTTMDMSLQVSEVVPLLEIGETSDVIETDNGFFIYRLVATIPESGDRFEDVRTLVEDRFVGEVRGQLVQALRDQSRYRIFIRRRGAPLSEILQELAGESDEAAAQQQ